MPINSIRPSLLITGGSGYLGRQLAQAAVEAGWRVTAAWFAHPLQLEGAVAAQVDLSDPRAVRALVQTAQPDAIVHTACSNASADQIAAILPAARNLTEMAAERGLRLVHVSTDLVFDGERAPYADLAELAPLDPYGQAKAESERLVAAHCPAAAIVRPSLIWGLAPLDRQTTWLLDGLRNGKRVILFTDEYRCPVHVSDLCALLLELAARPDLSGPFNAGGAQALSRWEFGLRLLRALGLPAGPNLVPGLVKDSGLVRARDLTLMCARAQSVLPGGLRGVDQVLEEQAAGRGRRPRFCEG